MSLSAENARYIHSQKTLEMWNTFQRFVNSMQGCVYEKINTSDIISGIGFDLDDEWIAGMKNDCKDNMYQRC